MTAPGAAPRDPALAPQVAGIADYEFVRSLGAGPRGRVFLARPPARLGLGTLDRGDLEPDAVAVRVLAVPATAAAFLRASAELRRAAAVASPHVLTLLDTGQQQGVFYTAMEYASGGTLAAPADSRALLAVADAAAGAADLHSAGLVHRGIAPGNVHLTPHGAKLADPDLRQIFLPGVLVSAGADIAALEYVDPSLLRGEPARPHHDVWSLGALLHRVLTGIGLHRPLPPDPVAALRVVLRSAPRVSPALPGHLAALVRACLSPPPDRPRAREVAERLRQVPDR